MCCRFSVTFGIINKNLQFWSVLAEEITLSELDAFIQTLQQEYALDFSIKVKSVLKCRLKSLLETHKIRNVQLLLERFHQTPNFIEVLKQEFCIPNTEFFRDISLWQTLHNHVVSLWKDIPHLSIVFPYIGTGEELLSLLIFLYEHQLLEKTKIYAGELCETALKQIQQGTFNTKAVEGCQKNYIEAGGKAQLLDYFMVLGGQAIFKKEYLSVCEFQLQPLMPSVSASCQVVWFRNQLIYHQVKAGATMIDTLCEPLVSGGLLVLGYGENLTYYTIKTQFQRFSAEDKIYQKI